MKTEWQEREFPEQCCEFTSLVYNFRNSSWDVTSAGGTSPETWKSPDSLTGQVANVQDQNFYLCDTIYNWEWRVIHEFSIDLCADSCDPSDAISGFVAICTIPPWNSSESNIERLLSAILVPLIFPEGAFQGLFAHCKDLVFYRNPGMEFLSTLDVEVRSHISGQINLKEVTSQRSNKFFVYKFFVSFGIIFTK